MLSVIQQFKENIRRVRELGGVANAVSSLAPAIDITDLWRSQIVLAVSALDYFIHDLTVLGMIECSKGSRQKTDAYARFDLPLAVTESVASGIPAEVWLGEAVRQKLSWQSFQDPDKMADAIRLVSAVKLWERVGVELGMAPKDVKTRLKLIVERRNKIAHEADLDPTSPGTRWPISASMANESIDYVEKICAAIYKIVTSP